MFKAVARLRGTVSADNVKSAASVNVVRLRAAKRLLGFVLVWAAALVAVALVVAAPACDARSHAGAKRVGA